MKTATLVILLTATVAVGSAQTKNVAVACERLSSLRLPNTTITLAQPILKGAFALPGAGPAEQPKSLLGNLPDFCRVTATLKPTSDSNIEIEVWLPATDWNGKFQGVGGGGWAGRIPTPAMLDPLAQGYAVAATDTGHEGAGAGFAVGHPERLTDYSHRAVHEMTVAAKAIVAEHYGRAASLSYWSGCSLGGQQGLKEAQMHPDDYDGIVAGAPTYNRTHLHAWQLWMALSATKDDNARNIPSTKYGLIHNAVLTACDASDGLKDGLISDPLRCHFDPATLRCAADDGLGCLTEPQIDTAKRLYATALDPQTGRVLYPGVSPGTELGWAQLIAGPQPFALATEMFKHVVHQEPNWDWHTFDVSRDTATADAQYGATLNADSADLRAFRERGGKILMWHGWADALVPPQATIDYFQDVVRTVGSSADDFVKLFMAPGVSHCGGGSGPNQFNAIAAIERWREAGIAPVELIASRVNDSRVDLTRPLCPFPQVAQYQGMGTPSDAANFRCKAP